MPPCREARQPHNRDASLSSAPDGFNVSLDGSLAGRRLLGRGQRLLEALDEVPRLWVGTAFDMRVVPRAYHEDDSQEAEQDSRVASAARPDPEGEAAHKEDQAEQTAGVPTPNRDAAAAAGTRLDLTAKLKRITTVARERAFIVEPKAWRAEPGADLEGMRGTDLRRQHRLAPFSGVGPNRVKDRVRSGRTLPSKSDRHRMCVAV